MNNNDIDIINDIIIKEVRKELKNKQDYDKILVNVLDLLKQITSILYTDTIEDAFNDIRQLYFDNTQRINDLHITLSTLRNLSNDNIPTINDYYIIED